jgi:hypothetical protein
MAKAFGIREAELSQFQHLTNNEIHAAVGNGVCIEMGQAMGQILRKFWDPDWFYSQLKKREKIQKDVCCLEGGVISTINEPVENTGKDAYEKGISWATPDDEEQIQRRTMKMHAHKQALEDIRQLEKWSNTAHKVRQRKKQQADARNPIDRVRKESRTEYANHNMNERLKLRRRLQTVLRVQELDRKQENEIGWDVDLEQHGHDGQSRVFQAEAQELEDMPTPEELCPYSPATSQDSELRGYQERDKSWSPLIRQLEGKPVGELSQHEKTMLIIEAEKYTLYGDAKILCKVSTSDRTSSTFRICVPTRQQNALLRACLQRCQQPLFHLGVPQHCYLLFCVIASSIHPFGTRCN